VLSGVGSSYLAFLRLDIFGFRHRVVGWSFRANSTSGWSFRANTAACRKIHRSSWVLHTPIRILNVNNTKKFQKNLKFGDIKPGFSIYSRVKFHKKIPGNVSAVKEILFKQKIRRNSFFSLRRIFLSFLPRIRFLVFFHEISSESRSDTQV
jgi:hypothetical protein